MSENYSSKRGVNFKSLSDVTKRLISGPGKESNDIMNNDQHGRPAWSGLFLAEITKQLRVTISTKASPRYLHFTIKGQTPNVKAALNLLTVIDQHAGVIANDHNLTKAKAIQARDYEVMGVYMREQLAETKTALNIELGKDKPQLIGPTMPAKSIIANDFAAAGTDQPKVQATKPSTKSKNLLKTKFEPSNISQAIGYTAISHDDIDVMFLGGAAGGGKTYLAIAAGLDAVSSGRCSAIELYRPDQGAGQKQGAVPGDIQKKEDIFLDTVSSTLHQLTGKDLKEHLRTGTVKEAGTPFRKRGATFLNTFVIVDEAQNLTPDQAKMLLTRIGEGAKIILTGDISSNQNDLKGRCPGLAYLIAAQAGAFNRGDEKLKRGMAFVEFTKGDSIARHRLLPSIHEAFENLSPELQAAMNDMDQVPPKVAAATKIFMDAANSEMAQAAKATYTRFEAAAKQRFSAIFGIKEAGNVVQFATPAFGGRNP